MVRPPVCVCVHNCLVVPGDHGGAMGSRDPRKDNTTVTILSGNVSGGALLPNSVWAMVSLNWLRLGWLELADTRLRLHD